ncbi:hypothetical protein D3C72_895180 [compost metagenome]
MCRLHDYDWFKLVMEWMNLIIALNSVINTGNCFLTTNSLIPVLFGKNVEIIHYILKPEHGLLTEPTGALEI